MLAEYWWVLFIVIPLVWIYIKLSNRQTFANMSFREMGLVLEFGCYFLLVYLGQRYLFSGHIYFLLSIPLFVTIWSLCIFLLLAGRNIYVIETTFQGEKFYDLENVKEVIVPHTSHRILIMDEGVYKLKKHSGDIHFQFWKGSDRIKFTDYYDDSAGVFYHPRIQQLHNITFYAFKSFWVKMRDELPNLIDQNTLLTWLSNWRLAFKMDAMKENFEQHLKAVESQHEHKPFMMPETLEDIFKRKSAEKHKDIEQSEQPIKPEPVEDDNPDN